MSRGTLDDLYLDWLYNQVVVEPQRLKYWRLLRQLYKTEFTYFVPNDGNRAEDGKDLRYEWADRCGIVPTQSWLDLGCSFLEMMIALSRRMCFEAEETPEYWFWHLLKNLGFDQFHDHRSFPRHEIASKVRAVLARTYDMTGNGGLFPLQHPSKDQRKVELWYQMSEYLLQDL